MLSINSCNGAIWSRALDRLRGGGRQVTLKKSASYVCCCLPAVLYTALLTGCFTPCALCPLLRVQLSRLCRSTTILTSETLAWRPVLAAAWAAGEVPCVMPAIYALYVINKSGGLIYNKVRVLEKFRFCYSICAC